jgi:hypothetical protein
MSTDTFMELLQEEMTAEPDPRFAAEMDEWVAAGFPRRDQRSPRRTVAWLDRAVRAVRSPLGAAGAATAVAALVIAVLLVGEATQTSTTGGGGDVAATSTVPSDSGAESSDLAEPAPEQRSLAPSPPATGGVPPQGRGAPRIERSSQITLAAPADDFQSVADRILKVTDSHDGFVLRSNVSTGENPSGDFQLRVPGDQLQATLRDLAALGDVRARNDMGQDVTREYVSVTDQLTAARAERRALLRRLSTATDDGRIQQLRDRLDQNARELGSLRSQIRDLRERTNYASVSVTLVEKKGGDGNGGAAGGSGTDDALDDSLGLLVGSFNWLLRALGVLIPAGLLGGAAWWAARTFRRRRREAVLF